MWKQKCMYVFLKATLTVQEHAGILAEVAGLPDVAGVARVVEELEPKMSSHAVSDFAQNNNSELSSDTKKVVNLKLLTFSVKWKFKYLEILICKIFLNDSKYCVIREKCT